MRDKVLSLVAAAALLASVGGAYAKGPVTLTDGQLDTVTAGDEVNTLLALTDSIIAFLNAPLTASASLRGGATGTVTPSTSIGAGATVTPLASIGGIVTP